jgi:RimJ/RimL family protein N-acetyltransferase
LEELHASIDEDNVSSLRMIEGCGFSRVGKRGRDLLFVKRGS